MKEYTGEASAIKTLERKKISHYGVKESVFPFNMFHEVDPLLGPEMRSTGEVLGIADNIGMAFAKAQEAAGVKLPTGGKVIMSVNDRDKEELIEVAHKFVTLGFEIMATGGTYDYLTARGVKATKINKLGEGRPNIVDYIINGDVKALVNTPAGKQSMIDDSEIRKAAIKKKLCYFTTIAAAKAMVTGIEEMQKGGSGVKSLQLFHSEIT
jgi:carbamoyl-phosphate synthase large subunit